MKDIGLPRIAWIGLGLLIISAILLSLGQREIQPHPAISSFAPSGTSILAELLRKEGYQVSADRSMRPRIGPNDTVVLYFPTSPASFFADLEEVEDEEAPPDPLEEAVRSHLVSGGNALILPLEYDFLRASRGALTSPPETVTPVAGNPEFSITRGGGVPYTSTLANLIASGSSTNLYRLPDGIPEVTGFRLGDGTAIVVSDGIVSTNRFIDQHQNAEFILKLFSLVTSRDGRIVFAEASFGNVSEKGLLETIGPWANAAWQQLLILALVVVYTLGKRLGIAESDRPRQRGMRELVDAVADTMTRAKSLELAMTVALNRAENELKTALKLPRNVDRQKLHERLPISLQKALVALEVAAKDRDTPASDAQRRILRVDREVDAFLGGRRQVGRRRATIRK